MMNDDGKRLDAARTAAREAVKNLAAIYDEWATDAYRDEETVNTGDYFRDRAREVRECIDRIGW